MTPIRVGATDFDWTRTAGWYQVDLEAFTLEFYFRPSDRSRAFVFSPGWMNRSVYAHPYFQRISWFNNLEGVGISLADPTLDLHESVQIGWFVGTRDVDYARMTARYLERLFDHLRIPRERTLFFGSSAGGFASLAFASHMTGAKALAANPQTDITRFHEPTELGAMTRAAFGSFNLTMLTPNFRSRVSIGELWKAHGRVPRSILVLNTFDSWHIHNHLVPLVSALDGLEVDGRLEVRFYSEAAKGHNPPGPDMLIPMMDELVP